MRQSPLGPAHVLVAAFTLVALASPAAAQAVSGADSETSQIGPFRLHQSIKACGKKWLKKAALLTAEQLEWMLRREHKRYRLTLGERTVMTLELLSTASFRDCDLETAWSTRENTVRVTYFEADGGRKTRLHSFARDEIFLDRSPTFYGGLGKVLLCGVTVKGTEACRWLEVDRLPQVLAEARARSAPFGGTRIAAADPGGR